MPILYFQVGCIVHIRPDESNYVFQENVYVSFMDNQAQFADIVGIPVATLRNWEQGRTNPEGPARVLIRAIKNNPRGVIKAINTV